MKLIPTVFLATAALSLGACGGDGPVAEEANSGSLPGPQTVNASDPSGAAPPANALSRQVNSRSSGGSVPAIPAGLQGRWGLKPGDCVPGGVNLGLLEIGDSEVRFYESVARPVGNANASPDSYAADFTFTGEGQSWTRFESMRLEDGKLVRTESSPMASYTYAKCS